MKAYSPHEHKPLLGYAVLTAAFNGLAAAYVVDHKRSGRRWPQRFPAGDFALMAGATYKLSRLISKDKVTSALRSPFTRFKEEAGPSEVEEEARSAAWVVALGVPVGLVAWLIARLFLAAGFPAPLSAIVGLAALSAASAALVERGLAETIDRWQGHARSPGVAAVLVLVFTTLVRAAAIVFVEPTSWLWLFVATAVAGRSEPSRCWCSSAFGKPRMTARSTSR